MAGPPPLFPTIPAGLWQQPRVAHSGLWQTTHGRLRMMVAFLEMHKLPAFPWRNLFAGHNTNRPYSHGGSVNKALTDNEVCSLAPGSGGRSCTLRLENSFQAGDGRALTVVGDAKPREEDAVGLACKVALAILLQRGPKKVWLLEKAWQLPDSRTFVQQLAALLWEDDDGRGLAADSPERDYLLSQVELQLRERGFGGLLDHPLAIGADRFPSAPQPPQPAAGGMQQLPRKAPPPQRLPQPGASSAGPVQQQQQQQQQPRSPMPSRHPPLPPAPEPRPLGARAPPPPPPPRPSGAMAPPPAATAAATSSHDPWDPQTAGPWQPQPSQMQSPSDPQQLIVLQQQLLEHQMAQQQLQNQFQQLAVRNARQL